ncbi:hypothetical protein F3Y22_tig00110641pilonHSYRG00017 [Hibiscus syriacus]|uniref:SWIM-type domain-containing protein n=1 Tax=Hibiscus syriacus TaxID=106335 RepID=A0A6A2ZYL2_HIBSY|nr:hypothetical protein F3Y22_tig00110641pilonHSYRG00017 [Hibiscus syriacus]
MLLTAFFFSLDLNLCSFTGRKAQHSAFEFLGLCYFLFYIQFLIWVTVVPRSFVAKFIIIIRGGEEAKCQRRRKLREVEQAAISLMALFCGSVFVQQLSGSWENVHGVLQYVPLPMNLQLKLPLKKLTYETPMLRVAKKLNLEPLSGFRLFYQRKGKVYLLTDNEDVERFIAYISVSQEDDVTLYIVEPRSSEVGSVAGSNQLSSSTLIYGAHNLDDDEPTEKIVSTSQYSKFDLGKYPDFDLGQYSDFDDVSEEETDLACNDFDIGKYLNFDDETAAAEDYVVDDNEEEVTTVNEHVEHSFCNSYNPEEEKEEEEVPEEKKKKKIPREYNWNMPELLQILEEELVKIAVDCYTKVIRIKKDDCFDTKEDLKIALYTKCVEDGYQLKVNKSSKYRFETRCMIDKNWYIVGHEIMTDMNAQFKISISYSQAWRAKCYALELLRGSPEASFSQLSAYCHNLKLKNPRSVTHIKIDRDGHFEFLFIAIGVAIRSFITYMYPVIIVDGAHLKGRYLGVNLLAVAMDANNEILPIAYGVGKSETSDSWTWFIGHLRDCIGLISNLTIIFDRENSIDNAIRRWSRVHQLGARYGFMTSNSAESITALSPHSRKLPITMLMEFFRASIQQWYYKKRNHEVLDNNLNGLVDLNAKTCSCMKWKTSGYPCGHVIKVILHLNQDDSSAYAMDCYTTEVYQQTYAEIVYPIPHPSE